MVYIFMVNYKCDVCGYSATHRPNFEKHCKTIRHVLKKDFSPKLADVSHTIEETEEAGFECKYCGQLYKHSSSLSKHVKYNCTKNKDEDLQELVRLMNLQLQQQNEQILSQNKQIEKLMSKLQMQNCYNNNTVNNIKILAYKDTDLSHLTDQDFAFCIKQVNFCVKSMIEKVHFNPDKPENMNIYISNIKDKYLMVYEDGNWNLKNKKDQLETLYEEKEMLLEEWLDEEQHKHPELKQKFEKYIENKESDETLNMIKDEIKLMMYNKGRFMEIGNS